MAKHGLKYYIPGGIALLFGIAAFCMMFLTAVSYSRDGVLVDTSYSYTGAQLAFGYTESIGEGALEVSTTILNFNFMAFIAFLLPLVGGILALLFQNGLVTKIVTCACFAVGAAFLFSMVGFATIGMEEFQQAVVEELSASLGVGPIIGAILAILGGVVCLFKGSIAKAFDK